MVEQFALTRHGPSTPFDRPFDKPFDKLRDHSGIAQGPLRDRATLSLVRERARMRPQINTISQEE